MKRPPPHTHTCVHARLGSASWCYSCPSAGTSPQDVRGQCKPPTKDIPQILLEYDYHEFLEIIFLRSGEILPSFGTEKSVFRENERVRVRTLQSKTDG